jgi:hypothetical protein
MMRLVALRLRSDLDSHSRTVTEWLTFQKSANWLGSFCWRARRSRNFKTAKAQAERATAAIYDG